MSLYNVKAFGNSQTGMAGWIQDAVVNALALNHLTSVSNPWTAADVGKTIYIGGSANPFAPAVSLAGVTITAFNAPGDITFSGPPSNYGFIHGFAVWGQDDTPAFVAAQAAALTDVNAKGTVFVPSGNYLVTSRVFDGVGNSPPSFRGQDKENTFILPSTNLAVPGDGTGALIESLGVGNYIGGFTVQSYVDDMAFSDGQSYIRIGGSRNRVADLIMQNLGSSAGDSFAIDLNNCNQLTVDRLWVHTDPSVAADPGNMGAVRFGNSAGTIRDLLASNYQRNLRVMLNPSGTGGITGAEGELVFYGGLIDENAASFAYSVEVIQSGSMVAHGLMIWANGGAASYAAHVDGTSLLRLSGCDIGPFGTSGALTNKALLVDVGGECVALDTIFRAGGGSPISVTNSGKFRDSSSNRYRIAAGGNYADVDWRTAFSLPNAVWR